MPTQAQTDLTALRANLHELIVSWRKRAKAAERGRMPQIAMDLNDCADELTNVVRGIRNL